MTPPNLVALVMARKPPWIWSQSHTGRGWGPHHTILADIDFEAAYFVVSSLGISAVPMKYRALDHHITLRRRKWPV